jgi:hypothetical protein
MRILQLTALGLSALLPSAMLCAQQMPPPPNFARPVPAHQASAQSSTPPTASAPPAIATRQEFFTIPFSVPNASAADAPVEVRLFVSSDQGKSWQLFSRQHPSAGKFEFRAPRDGEYWFASRTIDRSGQMRPARQYEPELRVTIDTVSPELELIANEGPAGEVETRWQVADPNLIPTTFKIFYRHSDFEDWQPVAVELPRDAQQGTLSGQTRWWPQRAGGKLEVRAEVQDAAGNTNVVQRVIDLPRVASNYGSRPSERSVPWPADEVVGQPQTVRPNVNSFQPGSTRNTTAPSPRPAPIGSQIANRVEIDEPTVQPPTTQPPSPAPSNSGSFLPPGERPQMTRSKRFNLEYDIQGVGPSGVARVELWATRDGGRLWERWGTDDDKQSPYSVEVDREGIFGFRIVVIGGNGLGGQLPQSGDEAECWIGIDQTAPQGAITAAQYGRADNVGMLSISWQAQDEVALHPRPITLLFSGHPDGPWTTIAAGLPNDGQYQWQVDQRVPANIYLRLEVLDEAGNLHVHQLERPIANDGLIPRGRIRNIQPVEDAADAASRRWPRW